MIVVWFQKELPKFLHLLTTVRIKAFKVENERLEWIQPTTYAQKARQVPSIIYDKTDVKQKETILKNT